MGEEDLLQHVLRAKIRAGERFDNVIHGLRKLEAVHCDSEIFCGLAHHHLLNFLAHQLVNQAPLIRLQRAHPNSPQRAAHRAVKGLDMHRLIADLHHIRLPQATAEKPAHIGEHQPSCGQNQQAK